MSWSLFHTECMALTGMKHVSRIQYAQIMSTAYHNCMMRHVEILTGGGVAVTLIPKIPLLFTGFLAICNMNLMQHNQINWVDQVGKFVKLYWTATVITGPTGVVTVTSPGIWVAPPVIPNINFNIILWTFEAVSRIHLMTLTGTYVSAALPGVVTPWSGALFQTIA